MREVETAAEKTAAEKTAAEEAPAVGAGREAPPSAEPGGHVGPDPLDVDDDPDDDDPDDDDPDDDDPDDDESGDGEDDYAPTYLERLYARTGVPERIGVWAPRAMALVGLGAVGAFVSAFLPWAHARLTDRGADLLVVTANGTDYRFTGRWVIAFAGLVAAAAAYVLVRPRSRLVPAVTAVLGVGIVVAAIVGEGNNAPTVHKLRNLRIGTVEVENPTAHTTVGHGLWLTVAAGLVIAVTSLAWLAVVSRERIPDRAGGPPSDY